MFKKIMLILLLVVFSVGGVVVFNVNADDVAIPDILTDSVNGPKVWVKADTGIETIDGKKVWRDLSGNENHMTVYGNPSVKKRAINQRPAMELKSGSTAEFFSVQFDEKYIGESTLFIVANMKEFSEYKGLFSTSTPQNKKSLNTFEGYLINNQIESGSMNANQGDINKDTLFPSRDRQLFGNYQDFILRVQGTYEGGVWKRTHLTTFYGDYDTNSQTTKVSQVYDNSNKNNGLSVGAYNAYEGLSLGSRWGFEGETPNSEYAEAILFTRALSDAEIQGIAEYLSQKYFQPFPPTDGIEYNMKAEKTIDGDDATVTVTLDNVEGSIYCEDFYVVVQLYADAERTMPRDTLVEPNGKTATFTYPKNLYATIMCVSDFGAQNKGNIGTNLAHPIKVD